MQEYPELEALEESLGPWEAYTAYCAGPQERNSFYGHGIVDALGAVEDD
ncbi:MAG TPA: hypothetical protein VG408_04795 [Actinomycetota bacterium]|nr:hypothetical protein [Actinomycetota bacterium]